MRLAMINVETSKGGQMIVETPRYRKPDMTNLPRELGAAIFNQIMSSPAPDRDNMKRESEHLIRENIKIRENEIARESSSK